MEITLNLQQLDLEGSCARYAHALLPYQGQHGLTNPGYFIYGTGFNFIRWHEAVWVHITKRLSSEYTSLR